MLPDKIVNHTKNINVLQLHMTISFGMEHI